VTGVNGLFCLLNENIQNITFFYSVTVYISIKYKRRVFLTIDEPFEPYEPLEPVEPRQRAEPLGLRTSEYPNFWLHGISARETDIGTFVFLDGLYFVLEYLVYFFTDFFVSQFLKEELHTNKNKIHLQYNI